MFDGIGIPTPVDKHAWDVREFFFKFSEIVAYITSQVI